MRELRNHGGDVIARVEAGERIVVTRDGEPVAELRPLPRRPLTTAALIRAFGRLRAVDPARLRADVDGAIDQSL